MCKLSLNLAKTQCYICHRYIQINIFSNILCIGYIFLINYSEKFLMDMGHNLHSHNSHLLCKLAHNYFDCILFVFDNLPYINKFLQAICKYLVLNIRNLLEKMSTRKVSNSSKKSLNRLHLYFLKIQPCIGKILQIILRITRLNKTNIFKHFYWLF